MQILDDLISSTVKQIYNSFTFYGNSSTLKFDDFSEFQNIISDSNLPANVIMKHCARKSICDSPLNASCRHEKIPALVFLYFNHKTCLFVKFFPLRNSQQELPRKRFSKSLQMHLNDLHRDSHKTIKPTKLLKAILLTAKKEYIHVTSITF